MGRGGYKDLLSRHGREPVKKCTQGDTLHCVHSEWELRAYQISIAAFLPYHHCPKSF